MSRFTDWLRKSGTKYKYGPLTGQEIVDELNFLEPLYNGLKTSDFATRPAGRVFVGLFTTPINLFNAIMGDHYDLGYKGHGRKGRMDVLIFPLVSRRLITYAHDTDADLILGSAAFIVGAPLEITRFVLGASLTVTLTPVAYVANMVTSTISHVFNYFKNTMDKKTRTIVTPKSSSNSSNDNSYNFLHKNGLSLDKTCDNQEIVSQSKKSSFLVVGEPAKPFRVKSDKDLSSDASVQPDEYLSSTAYDCTPKRNSM